MANMDRVYWVCVLRPQLIADGNLIETEDMRKEFKKLSKGQKTPTKVLERPAPLSAAVRTPAGDYVPPPVDFKARASGERDEPEPDGVPV
jgi:hypothetical protein